MSKYGEPWDTNYTGNIWSETDDPKHDGDSPLIFTPWEKPDNDGSFYSLRATQCVNALVGIEHPEAVRELINLSQRAMEWMAHVSMNLPKCETDVGDPIIDAIDEILTKLGVSDAN